MTRSDTLRRSWSRQIEAASLRVRELAPSEASRNFDRGLEPAQQMQLVHELVTTRAAELTLGYRNVVMIAAGHKKRNDSLGRERLLRKPCVVFVVRDKWDPSFAETAGDQCIPRRLLAYATINDRRVLCAVPTDVQHERHFYGATPQSQRALYPADSVVTNEFGTLTCVVRVRRRRHVLSCRHVLSPLPEIADDLVTTGLTFSQLLSPTNPPGGPRIGASEGIAGPLRDRSEPSFDAQLGSIDDAAWPTLRSLLADMPLSTTESYVGTRERFDQLVADRGFEILVPDNNPNARMKPRPTYAAQFDTYLRREFHFDYPVRIGGQRRTCKVSHWELLKFKVAAGRVPLPGDSGSPVVTWNSDGSCTLVGMHIAGVEGECLSYTIPSWQLFAASNYLGLSASERIEPINP